MNLAPRIDYYGDTDKAHALKGAALAFYASLCVGELNYVTRSKKIGNEAVIEATVRRDVYGNWTGEIKVFVRPVNPNTEGNIVAVTYADFNSPIVESATDVPPYQRGKRDRLVYVATKENQFATKVKKVNAVKHTFYAGKQYWVNKKGTHAISWYKDCVFYRGQWASIGFGYVIKAAYADKNGKLWVIRFDPAYYRYHVFLMKASYVLGKLTLTVKKDHSLSMLGVSSQFDQNLIVSTFAFVASSATCYVLFKCLNESRFSRLSLSTATNGNVIATEHSLVFNQHQISKAVLATETIATVGFWLDFPDEAIEYSESSSSTSTVSHANEDVIVGFLVDSDHVILLKNKILTYSHTASGNFRFEDGKSLSDESKSYTVKTDAYVLTGDELVLSNMVINAGKQFALTNHGNSVNGYLQGAFHENQPYITDAYSHYETESTTVIKVDLKKKISMVYRLVNDYGNDTINNGASNYQHKKTFIVVSVDGAETTITLPEYNISNTFDPLSIESREGENVFDYDLYVPYSNSYTTNEDIDTETIAYKEWAASGDLTIIAVDNSTVLINIDKNKVLTHQLLNYNVTKDEYGIYCPLSVTNI